MSKYELENASKFFEQFDENTKKEFAIDGFMVEISTIFIKYRVKNALLSVAGLMPDELKNTMKRLR